MKAGQVRGITSWRADESAGWAEVDEQRVPRRFFVETTVDYQWVSLGEGDEEGNEAGVPEGRHRPYERATFVVEDDPDGAPRVAVEAYELRRWPGLSLSDTRLRDRGLEEMGARAVTSLTRGRGGPGFRDWSDEDRAARRSSLATVRHGSRGRPPVGEDEVREVARLYLAAEADGLSPTKHVRAELGLSRDQASRRVKRARTLGLLPAYERGSRS